MSQTIQTNRDFAIHDGGTKFYQVFAFAYGDRSVFVKHWGAHQDGVQLVPKNFGQCDVQLFESMNQANREMEGMRKTKMKRGYKFKPGSAPHDSMEALKFRRFVFETMKPADATQIVMHLMTGEAARAAGKPPDPVKTTPKKELTAADRGTEWGSW